MMTHAPIALVAVTLPIIGCSAEVSPPPADPCAAVKERYAAHRERVAPKVREVQAREKADIAEGKSSLERNTKFRVLMAELEGEEMRYQVGMRDCGEAER